VINSASSLIVKTNLMFVLVLIVGAAAGGDVLAGEVYSAFYHKTSNALRHGSHNFTCKLHHACLYSPATEHHRPLAGTHFTIPRRVEG